MKRLGLLATLIAGAALAGCGGGSDSGTTAINTGALSALGQACTSASQCTSGFCASGVCCNNACTSGCGACNLAGKVGTCSPVTGGTVCRAAAGECDVAETCSGSSTTCPADAKKGNAMACTDDGNPCTTDLCNGSSATCQHAAGNNGTACADDGNPCTTDRCNGTSTACQHAAGNNGTACPDDGNPCTTDRCNGTSTACQHAAGNNGTACLDDGNPCTTDRCNGTSTVCQHAAGNAGVTCRAVAGACDRAESCTGTSAACPTDGFLPSTTVCRTANGACDRAESCTGTSAACPTDGFLPSTTVCRAANGTCDAAESCTGTSGTCPTDGFLPSTTVCRAANGTCDAAESCTGTSAACPADGFLPSTTVCRAANGACDAAESCPGTSAACPADGFKPSTTVCRTANGPCDVAENCPGTGAACPADSFKQSTVTCRLAVDVCDATETCTGTGAACPTDGFKPSTTVCRAANGACDVAESCTGTSAACPTDALKPNGAACSDGNTCTQNDVCQSGACVGSNPTVCSQCPQTMTAWLSSPGLVAHWAFDDQAASVTDSSGNNHTGVASITTGGGYDQAHPPLANDVGSFRFGGSDYVSVPDSPALQIAGNLTVSAWVRVTASAAEYNVVSKDTAGTAFSNYNLGIINNQPYFGIGFRAGSQEGGSQVASPASQVGGQASCDTGGCMVLAHAGFVDSTHPLGTWRLLTGVYDNSAKSITVYLDCDTTASGTFATSGVPFTNTETLQIGKRKWNPASGLVGNVDSVAIWNRALSPVEVTTHTQCRAWTCASSSGTCVSASAVDGALCDDGSACTQGDVCTAGTCGGASAFACAAPDSCHGAGTCNAGAAAPAPPSTQDLIGWWKLDGNGVDASGGGHDLTIEGNVTPAPGRVGLGMKFDGTSCMTAPIWDAARMTGASGVTLMAWIKPSDQTVCPNGQNALAVMGRGWDYSLGSWCYPGPLVAGTGDVRPAGAQTWGYPGGIGQISPNQWALIALTWDQQQLVVYVNGTRYAIGYPDAGEFGDIESTFAIGCMISQYFTGAERIMHFTGTIDEAMLWRRVLTGQEIQSYANAADPCTHPVFADGTTCTDNNLCTQTDSCQAGTCVGANPVTCTGPGSDQCHVGGTCDPASGTCSSQPKPDGTACNDGNACTHADSCQAGACIGGNPVECVPSDSCHGAGTCDPGTGVCTNPPLPEGTCQVGAFDYDKAGRLIHDRGADLTYDAYDQLRAVAPEPTTTPPQLQGARIEEVGDLGGNFNNPRFVNQQGQIAGYTVVSNVQHGFLQAGGVPAVDLNAVAGVPGNLVALGINDAGTVAGNFWDGSNAEHVFLYNPATGFQDLGVNSPSANVSFINDAGQMAGSFNLPNNGSHAARYTPGVGWEDLGVLPGGASSFAWTVDDLGNVFGSSTVADTPASGFDFFGHAFLFNDTLGLIDLNNYTDPALDQTVVTANRTNGDWIAGVVSIGGRDQAYRLKLSNGLIEPLGDWQGNVFGYAINSYGEAVGGGFVDAANTHRAAFVFSDQYGFVNLNDTVDPASGWDLQTAFGINDAGDVIGWGYLNGVWSGFALHLPLRTSTGGAPMVAEVHTYGYDGLRTSTTTSPGTPGAHAQAWFTQDYTEHDGIREHYLRVGDRLVAKLTYTPPPGGMTMGMGRLRRPGDTSPDLGNLVAEVLLAMLLAGGLAVTVAGFTGKKRRPAWVSATAGPVTLFFVASCEMLGANRKSAETLWQRAEVVYFHRGVAPGPALTTNADGGLREERRYEPFGQPVDAKTGGTIGPVDFRREQQNSLGKQTDPNTGWSYHGARWMQPQSARWTSPDPATKGPTVAQLLSPWTLNPYQYSNQNPLVFFDPDGEAAEFTEDQISSLAVHAKAAGESGKQCLGTLVQSMKGAYGDENFKTHKGDDTLTKVMDRAGKRAQALPEAETVKFKIDRTSIMAHAEYAPKSPLPADVLNHAMEDKSRFGVFAIGPANGIHSITIVGEKKEGKTRYYWFDENTRRAVSQTELNKKVLSFTQLGLDWPTKNGGERGVGLDMWEMVPDATGSSKGGGSAPPPKDDPHYSEPQDGEGSSR